MTLDDIISLPEGFRGLEPISRSNAYLNENEESSTEVTRVHNSLGQVEGVAVLPVPRSVEDW